MASKRVPLSSLARQLVWERDKGVCGMCGEPVEFDDMEVDHIVPIAEGGDSSPSNLRAAHWRCNRKAVKPPRYISAGRRLRAFIAPDDLWEFVLQSGGSAWLRSLIRREMECPEAERMRSYGRDGRVGTRRY